MNRPTLYEGPLDGLRLIEDVSPAGFVWVDSAGRAYDAWRSGTYLYRAQGGKLVYTGNRYVCCEKCGRFNSKLRPACPCGARLGASRMRSG